MTREYFDSANIAESYSGVVLPLTCSFASLVYGRAYRSLLRESGVAPSVLARHPDVFDNLLGFFYGRMYYNMNNWYRMASFVPGYRRNKRNLELMITSNVREDITTGIRPSVILTVLYPFIAFGKLIVFGSTARRFSTDTTREIQTLRARNFGALSYAECVALFDTLMTRLLGRWYVALENDFLVMTYAGLLTKLLGETGFQSVMAFKSKATEQIEALSSLAQTLQATPLAWSAIQKGDAASFRVALSENPGAVALLAGYLEEFGGRFANELKLETVGVDEDISKLMSALVSYTGFVAPALHERAAPRFPFLKGIIVSFLLARFKHHAAMREEFRLLRSNAFSVVRHLFRRMGAILAENGAIRESDDVFYLLLDEIVKSDAPRDMALAEKVSARKRDYEEYRRAHPPIHFSTEGGRPPPVQSGETIRSVRKGMPASPGVVTGRVKIFKDFFMPSTINFEILVASHTDPGWTTLIGLSKGLIIEHGGALSHASIVARELGIPAVIGVSGATDSLLDGQVVTIDGSTGSVELSNQKP